MGPDTALGAQFDSLFFLWTGGWAYGCGFI